jgi:hypothetical protein
MLIFSGTVFISIRFEEFCVEATDHNMLEIF